MSDPERLFEEELDIFGREVDAALQCLYANLAAHGAARNSQVRDLLNTAPLFWNTILGALQTSAFVALGRIFDQQSVHNIDRLIGIAQNNQAIFSKQALARRKQGSSPQPPTWLPQYLKDAYVPRPADFRRLRSYIRRFRRAYEARYRPIRHQVYAHKQAAPGAQTEALFATTTIRELQQILTSLMRIHDALWQLFVNGNRPVLRPVRYSVKRMQHMPAPEWQSQGVHERITTEATRFLREAARASRASDGPKGSQREEVVASILSRGRRRTR